LTRYPLHAQEIHPRIKNAALLSRQLKDATIRASAYVPSVKITRNSLIDLLLAPNGMADLLGRDSISDARSLTTRHFAPASRAATKEQLLILKATKGFDQVTDLRSLLPIGRRARSQMLTANTGVPQATAEIGPILANLRLRDRRQRRSVRVATNLAPIGFQLV
jgi:hypothetical protein